MRPVVRFSTFLSRWIEGKTRNYFTSRNKTKRRKKSEDVYRMQYKFYTIIDLPLSASLSYDFSPAITHTGGPHTRQLIIIPNEEKKNCFFFVTFFLPRINGEGRGFRCPAIAFRQPVAIERVWWAETTHSADLYILYSSPFKKERKYFMLNAAFILSVSRKLIVPNFFYFFFFFSLKRLELYSLSGVLPFFPKRCFSDLPFFFHFVI